MGKCKHYNNWCEEEKRGCKNCYYDKEKALKNKDNKYNFIMIERKYLEELLRTKEKINEKEVIYMEEEIEDRLRRNLQ